MTQKNDFSVLISQEFSQDPDTLYLNHAAVSPWPARTRNAVQAFAEENQHFGARYYPRWIKKENELREQITTLINAPSPNDIALLKNTSEALSFVAYGLDWQAGDNIVISNQEFPSNRIVWESLQQFGVSVREVDLNSNENPEQALIHAIDSRTRLLSVSSVQYASGLRMQLDVLGAACKKHDVLFCVDAIQSIGALNIDVQAIQADFVMADGHKWMLGPEGVALFYCRSELREQLKLNEYGWHMTENMGDYTHKDWQPAATARRFECGSPNMLGIHALSASISLLLEIGIPQVEKMLLAKTRTMIELIQTTPQLSLASNPDPSRLSGIVTFRHQQQDSEQLYNHLMQSGVICACRGGGVRFSPHFYTPDDVLHQALAKVSLTD
jgi:cysteine desulfurase/selenocysteine lyase